MSTIYTVTRRGTFRAKVDTHNQCGVKGTAKFDYIVTVDGETLDTDRVLIEHFKLDETIVNTFGAGKWAGTCEEFAGTIVAIVERLIGARANRVTVALKPGAIAEISLSWTNIFGAASLPPDAHRIDTAVEPVKKVKTTWQKQVKKDNFMDYVPNPVRQSC